MKSWYSSWMCSKKNWQAVKQKTPGGKKTKKTKKGFIRQQHGAGLLLSADVFWHQWTAEAPQSAELTSIHTIASPQVWTWRTITFTAYAHSGSDIYISTCCDTSCGASPNPHHSQLVTPAGQGAALLELKGWAVSTAGFIVLLTPVQRRCCSCVSKSLGTSSEINQTVSQRSCLVVGVYEMVHSRVVPCQVSCTGYSAALRRIPIRREPKKAVERERWTDNNSSSLCQHVTGLPIWHCTLTMELDCK